MRSRFVGEAGISAPSLAFVVRARLGIEPIITLAHGPYRTSDYLGEAARNAPMKLCLTCQRTYADETLKFCRDDGTPLQSSSLSTAEAQTRRVGVTLGIDDLKPTRVFNSEAPLSHPTTSALPTTTRRRSSRKVVNSLAVLPLRNGIADPEMEYLSDGITESIINTLAQLPKLRVVSRSTVFRYKGQEGDPQEVGRQLGVRAVLTGRVRQVGNSLVIGVELIDVANDTQLWGEQYKRKFSNIFEVQGEIAQEISEKLRLKLTREDKRRLTKRHTGNPEAYQLYLWGRFFWNKRTPEGFEKSIEYFQRAIESDPDYALAYAGLADCYALLGGVIYSQSPPREVMPKAKAAALKALEIDNTLAEAHASLGLIKLTYDWDWSGAEKEFTRAFELNPNYATAHHWYAEYLIATGQLDEAVAELQRAKEIDPLSLVINANLGAAFYFARQYDQAVEAIRKTIELDSEFYFAHFFLGRVYEQKQEFSEAITELQEAIRLDESPDALGALGHTYAVSNNKGEAIKILNELMEMSEHRYVTPYNMAIIYAGLDDKDQAFEWLQKAYGERSGWLTWIKVEPQLDNLRQEAQFTKLMRDVGHIQLAQLHK